MTKSETNVLIGLGLAAAAIYLYKNTNLFVNSGNIATPGEESLSAATTAEANASALSDELDSLFPG